MNSNESPSLSAGNYSISQAPGGFGIFLNDELGDNQWVATAPDPEIAMKIVEGLVLVEMKRFYHPESTPTFKSADEDRPLPPFLRKRAEKS